MMDTGKCSIFLSQPFLIHSICKQNFHTLTSCTQISSTPSPCRGRFSKAKIKNTLVVCGFHTHSQSHILRTTKNQQLPRELGFNLDHTLPARLESIFTITIFTYIHKQMVKQHREKCLKKSEQFRTKTMATTDTD